MSLAESGMARRNCSGPILTPGIQFRPHLVDKVFRHSLCVVKMIHSLFTGEDLWVLAIGKSGNDDGLRPHVKYVGNMHGNEVRMQSQ